MGRAADQERKVSRHATRNSKLEAEFQHVQEKLRLTLQRQFGKPSEKVPGQNNLAFEDLKDALGRIRKLYEPAKAYRDHPGRSGEDPALFVGYRRQQIKPHLARLKAWLDPGSFADTSKRSHEQGHRLTVGRRLPWPRRPEPRQQPRRGCD